MNPLGFWGNSIRATSVEDTLIKATEPNISAQTAVTYNFTTANETWTRKLTTLAKNNSFTFFFRHLESLFLLLKVGRLVFGRRLGMTDKNATHIHRVSGIFILKEKSCKPTHVPPSCRMISDFFHPAVGGVENHIYMLSANLIRKGHKARLQFFGSEGRAARTENKKKKKTGYRNNP